MVHFKSAAVALFVLGATTTAYVLTIEKEWLNWCCERQTFTMVMDEFHSLSLQFTVKLKFLYQERM